MAEVNTIRADQHCEVDPVVDPQARRCRAQRRRNVAGKRQPEPIASTLVAQLDIRNPVLGTKSCGCNRPEGRVWTDDHVQTCSAGHAPACSARNRSMNRVEKSPARNRGSSMILRCSGMVV